MLDGVNDGREQAVVLAEVLSPHEAFKVNLIPYNPTGGLYRAPSRRRSTPFATTLIARGVPATIRLTRGRDIDAACGQLAAKAA